MPLLPSREQRVHLKRNHFDFFGPASPEHTHTEICKGKQRQRLGSEKLGRAAQPSTHPGS